MSIDHLEIVDEDGQIDLQDKEVFRTLMAHNRIYFLDLNTRHRVLVEKIEKFDPTVRFAWRDLIRYVLLFTSPDELAELITVPTQTIREWKSPTCRRDEVVAHLNLSIAALRQRSYYIVTRTKP